MLQENRLKSHQLSMYSLIEEETKKWKGGSRKKKQPWMPLRLLLNIYIQSWPGLMQIVFMGLHSLEFYTDTF